MPSLALSVQCWDSFSMSPLIKSGSVAVRCFPNQLAVIAADCWVNHLLCSSDPHWRPVAPQQTERGEEHTAAPPTEHLTPQLPARQITAAQPMHTNTHTFLRVPEETMLRCVSVKSAMSVEKDEIDYVILRDFDEKLCIEISDLCWQNWALFETLKLKIYIFL